MIRSAEKYLKPKHIFGWWLNVCHVRILVVTDSTSGGFGEVAGFHLGQVLKIVTNDPWSHIRFAFTKAHRQNSSEADVVDNFRFDNHDLTQYGQIWLFGINRSADPLSPAELKALAQFMDNGGGVFATGDHEDLGRAMCAEVPRVRSMRRWYYPDPGPNGEPVAPAQTGSKRHDTVMDLAGGGSQSDEIPQPIRPKWYYRLTGGAWELRSVKYPHPVLCGPDGVITYLPDHMHEGLCEVPADLSQAYTFDGYTTQEYPTVSGNQQPPEVIAWATSRNTDGAEFGVIAAYDGHRANVGRVVVDATWHHWFNINLVGFLAATDPESAQYDASVVPKWEAIKAYYRNVAVWLAPKTLQTCIRNGGWLLAAHAYDVRMTIRDLAEVRQRLAYLIQLGIFARDALDRIASQCQRTLWIASLCDRFKLPFPIEPWPPIGPPPLPDPPVWLDIEQLELIALGGAIHAVGSRFQEVGDAERLIAKAEDEIDALAREGAAAAFNELARNMEVAGKEMQKVLGQSPSKGR